MFFLCFLYLPSYSHVLFFVMVNFQPGVVSGCTAVVALLVKSMLYVANIGDSRCVVAYRGRCSRPMTTDHSPFVQTESLRIRSGGGKINKKGRINSNLNMSRSFGNDSCTLIIDKNIFYKLNN